MTTRRPDFFILGAPKCGTTALAQYLAEHPQVFMATPKEPHHYNTDHAHRHFPDRDAYLALFADAGPIHRRIGEASVWYLYSAMAVANIEDDLPGARYIVMLRNPVSMAPSLHEQLVFAGNESIADFHSAWRAQDRRRAGEAIPAFVTEPAYLLYREACSLGAQLRRLLARVDRGRVLIVFTEDLTADPRAVWTRVQDFLGLDDDGRRAFPVVNPAKVRRSRMLKLINDAYARLRGRLGFGGFGFGVLERVDRWNSRDRPRDALPERLRQELAGAFAEDVATLEALTGRDLSHWLR